MDCPMGYLIECPNCHNPVVLCVEETPTLNNQTYWEEDCGCDGIIEE